MPTMQPPKMEVRTCAEDFRRFNIYLTGVDVATVTGFVIKIYGAPTGWSSNGWETRVGRFGFV